MTLSLLAWTSTAHCRVQSALSFPAWYKAVMCKLLSNVLLNRSVYCSICDFGITWQSLKEHCAYIKLCFNSVWEGGVLWRFFKCWKLFKNRQLEKNNQSVETTNKIQRCNRIYYSKIYWRLNMFRVAYRSSPGAPNCICSHWFIYPRGDQSLSRLDNDWSAHGYINQRLQIQFGAPDDERYATRNMLSLQ